MRQILMVFLILASSSAAEAQDSSPVNETAVTSCPQDLPCPPGATCSCTFHDNGALRSVDIDHGGDGITDEQWLYDSTGNIQTTPESSSGLGGDATITFSVGIPRDELADNISGVGFGFDLIAGVRHARVPIFLGLHFGMQIYGSETRSERFSTTIPDVRVNVNTTNSIFLGHLVMRFRPDLGILRPYFDGLFGFKYFVTTTSIEEEYNHHDEEPLASSTNLDDATVSYGLGVGLDIIVYEDATTGGQGYINLGVRNLWGGEATYLEEGSVRRTDEGEISYDVSRSTTDLLLAHLGFGFLF